jgi:hypothetical protein
VKKDDVGMKSFKRARITETYLIAQSKERGVVISVRNLERLIERLDACKLRDWADLWLAGIGVGAALAAAALVGVLTLPITLSSAKDVLWALTATGTITLILCLGAYLTQRRGYKAEVDELRKDLQIYKDRAATPLQAQPPCRRECIQRCPAQGYR